MFIANLFSSTHRYASPITNIKKNRLHWVLEVRNGKSLLSHLVQLPAKAEGFFCGLFTPTFSRKLSLGLNKLLYNVLSNINIFPELKWLDIFPCVQNTLLVVDIGTRFPWHTSPRPAHVAPSKNSAVVELIAPLPIS